RVRAGRVENRHAPAAELRDRDVVDPGAGACDREHARWNLHLMHVVRAHEHAVRLRYVARDLVALAREAAQTRDGDVVERLNLEAHAQALLFSKSAMNSTSASTPSSGIAL